MIPGTFVFGSVKRPPSQQYSYVSRAVYMAIGVCSTADYEHCCMTTETKQKQYNNTQLRLTIINLAVSCMYHGYHTWYSLNLVDDMDHIFVAIPYADMGVFNAYTRFV